MCSGLTERRHGQRPSSGLAKKGQDQARHEPSQSLLGIEAGQRPTVTLLHGPLGIERPGLFSALRGVWRSLFTKKDCVFFVYKIPISQRRRSVSQGWLQDLIEEAN